LWPLGGPRVQAIADGSYARKTEADIVGSAYVVHSLEAALWSFLHEADFRPSWIEVLTLRNEILSQGARLGMAEAAAEPALRRTP